MNCTIPGPNIKVFGKAIHTLSKIGDDLYIEGQDDILSLRTVNSSRSAYACFEFSRSFFQSYNTGSLQNSTMHDSASQQELAGIHCKALSKSCLSVFRSLSQIDKTVTKCKVSLSLEESRLEIQFHCKHGIVKTYKLHIEDADSIKALYDTDSMSSAFVVPTRLLADSMTHFHTTTDEITFSPCPTHLEIANVGDSSVEMKSNLMVTKVKLHQSEFNSYHTDKTTHLTFCLRELRAIAAFCDFVGAALRTVFEEAGSPIIFLVRADRYTADFVLSTVNMGFGAESHTNIDGSSGASQQQSGTARDCSNRSGAEGNSQGLDALSIRSPDSVRPTPRQCEHQSPDEEVPYSYPETVNQSGYEQSLSYREGEESTKILHITTEVNNSTETYSQSQVFLRQESVSVRPIASDRHEVHGTPRAGSGKEQVDAQSPYVASFGTASCRSQSIVPSAGGVYLSLRLPEAICTHVFFIRCKEATEEAHDIWVR